MVHDVAEITGEPSLHQQIIGVLYERAGTFGYTLAQQADEILALVRANEPPGGWFHFGAHVDWKGQLEFSSDLDEGGLPLWERPLPTRSSELELEEAQPVLF